MELEQTLLGVGISLAIIVITLNLVRTHSLREEFAWLWLLAGLVTLLVTLTPQLLAYIADFLRLGSPIFSLMLISILFLVVIVLRFSVRFSQQKNEIKCLGQEVALMKTLINTLASKKREFSKTREKDMENQEN